MGGLDGLRISPAVPSDLDALGRLFPELAGYYRDRARQAGILLVARVGRRPLGAAYVSTRPAVEPEIVRRLGPVPMLHKLMVDETVRGRRVGTRIVRAAEIVLRRQGRRRVAVGVDLGNAGAVRLYLRLGYREWAWGLLDTVREHADEAGKVIVVPDVCRVFVKNL
ncbi:GNAT family N-acetyltransferase [Pseudosporangium ferrugineum]|uniref:Acetyltransferase (GNAT) family protein n=1 Tax=Pseudosporangium ferrugineum TaxID=439699 RepID=A0A2T0S4R8_9ACTN|nr:GNAT family N-acetyltransferase [Pseudosporangium ferrugineum]PRY28293.1 acetyltransferase (GNAT) family protein [Pseudosporangium ferrugineum]